MSKWFWNIFLLGAPEKKDNLLFPVTIIHAKLMLYFMYNINTTTGI